MYLVDEKDDVALGFDLINQPFHPALKLASELGAGDQRRHIQQVNLLIQQPERHIPRYNLLGNPFGNRRLADARFADQAGVVFLPAGEDLLHPIDFLITADNPVHLAVAGLFV